MTSAGETGRRRLASTLVGRAAETIDVRRGIDREETVCSRVLFLGGERVTAMVSTTVDEVSGYGPGTLADLYERHAPAAVRLAFLVTGDRERSRDIAQEAFVRVAARFRHRRFPDAFDAYLRRTVVNLCTSRFRHERVEREYVEREGGRRSPTTVEPPDLETRDELARALRSLPARQRAAVVLRYYEDLGEEGVADALRCSVPAARSLLTRGMQTLRTMVEER